MAEAGSYVVRAARPGDEAAVAALTARWSAEHNTHGQVPADVPEVAGWVTSSLLVVEQDGVLVGFARASEHRSEGLAVIPVGEPYVRVEDLYVVPEHRERGVGGRLLDRLLDDAAARGIGRALVSSASRDWERSVQFYRARGFAMWYVEMYR